VTFIESIRPILQEHKPIAVWLFAPVPEKSSSHSKIIPELRSLGSSWGLKVFVQVGSVTAARDAANDGADVIVAQGIDAGGHQWAQGVGIVSLVPEIRDMIQKEFAGKDIGLVAAGGIVNGQGVAAALALGKFRGALFHMWRILTY
jgi:nitronate monooxygenase